MAPQERSVRLDGVLRELDRAGVALPEPLVADLVAVLSGVRAASRPASPLSRLVGELEGTLGVMAAARLQLADAHTAALVAALTEDGFVTRNGARAFDADVLVERRLAVLTRADTLDVDTLALVATLGDRASFVESAHALPLGLGRATARLSLSLLARGPDRRPAPTARAHAANGFSGLARRGSIDALVPTELAWDDDELARRLLFDEVAYHAREDEPEPPKRLAHVLVDASAGMRGDRATFARALALSIARKRLAHGEDVEIRFFDSRLSEPLRPRGRTLPVLAVLSWVGERGRNTARVLGAFADEVHRVARESGRRQWTVLLTHGSTDLPRPLLQRIREVTQLSAVLVAPRGAARVAYADAVDRLDVVTADELRDPAAQVDRGAALLGSSA